MIHERIDPSVSPVGPSPALDGCVDLDVVDEQGLDIQAFDVGIGLEILQERDDDVDRLFRPSSLGQAELFGLARSTHVSVEPHERHTSLVVQNILQILLGFLKVHASDSVSHLPGVLEVHSQVHSCGLSCLLCNCWLTCEFYHLLD